MTLSKLRIYKPDGEYLEFCVGEPHEGIGKVKSIQQSNNTFTITFVEGLCTSGETFVSGFPYTTFSNFI